MAGLWPNNAWNLKARCDRIRYLSFISSSLNASVGVRHPRHFLGVLFKRSQIDFISRFESAATGASRGKYRRARLFRFSTEPFCHGACGSQNHASVPIPGFSLRQSRNSMPRSKVIDLRAGWGRGSMTPISLFIRCVVLRSLLRLAFLAAMRKMTCEFFGLTIWAINVGIDRLVADTQRLAVIL
jgi:hypothetical protein